MELHEKTSDELREMAKKLDLKVPGHITDEKLKDMVERAAIEHTVRVEEEVRNKLKLEAQIRRDIAEITATAQLNRVTIAIPENPTINDIVRLKKELGIKIKQPKPSRETVAIEKSKKVYALFRNLEDRDVDVTLIKGEKYRFHLWPDKIHVLPEWLIGNLRRTAVAPIYAQRKNPRTGLEYSAMVGKRERFAFDILGDAPADAEFGVVLDDAVLSKLRQPA